MGAPMLRWQQQNSPKIKLDVKSSLPHLHISVNNKKEGFMKQLQTIDADTLLSTPLPVTKFIVEELLPEGLHILAGSPNVG